MVTKVVQLISNSELLPAFALKLTNQGRHRGTKGRMSLGRRLSAAAAQRVAPPPPPPPPR